jgi:hypothetical protein
MLGNNATSLTVSRKRLSAGYRQTSFLALSAARDGEYVK